MNATSVERPEKIERLAMAVYPAFAMLAGMELDVFSTLKDEPLTGLQIAATLGVDPIRLHPLLLCTRRCRSADRRWRKIPQHA